MNRRRRTEVLLPGRPFWVTAGAPRIISATIFPVLTPLDDTQTPADGLPASATDTANYTSTAGTISSAVETYFVNGVAQPGTFDLDAGDVVYAEILVTDSAANTRTFRTTSITVSSTIDPNAVTNLGEVVTHLAEVVTHTP